MVRSWDLRWLHVDSAFKDAGLEMGSVEGYVGYVLGATVALDLLLLAWAFVVTGGTREKIFGGENKRKRCCGRAASIVVRGQAAGRQAWNVEVIVCWRCMVCVERGWWW